MRYKHPALTTHAAESRKLDVVVLSPIRVEGSDAFFLGRSIDGREVIHIEKPKFVPSLSKTDTWTLEGFDDVDSRFGAIFTVINMAEGRVPPQLFSDYCQKHFPYVDIARLEHALRTSMSAFLKALHTKDTESIAEFLNERDFTKTDRFIQFAVEKIAL